MAWLASTAEFINILTMAKWLPVMSKGSLVITRPCSSPWLYAINKDTIIIFLTC